MPPRCPDGQPAACAADRLRAPLPSRGDGQKGSVNCRALLLSGNPLVSPIEAERPALHFCCTGFKGEGRHYSISEGYRVVMLFQASLPSLEVLPRHVVREVDGQIAAVDFRESCRHGPV